MISHDPALRRLAEVNPAPEHLELPPISDRALLKAIVETGRSEQLRPRSVQPRSWRPGLVVAAAAFVAVLVVAGVMSLLTGILTEKESPVVTEPPVVTTAAPVPTTAPPMPAPASSHEVMITAVLPNETFTASGPAVDAGVMCDEGTMTPVRIDGPPEPSGDLLQYATEEEHTLICKDGTGEVTLSIDMRRSWAGGLSVFNGTWSVAGGSGSYEAVTGSGELAGGTVDSSRDTFYEYTGSLDLFATETTTATPSTEQYDVTITHPNGESFSATGSALDAGVVCSEGAIDTITISKAPLVSRFPLGGEYSDYYAAVEEHTLTCEDGSGAIVVGVAVSQAQLMSRYTFNGKWVVVRGSGDYERVAGSGDLEGRCDGDRSNCSYDYTGRLDLSRDPGVAPTVTAPIGRYDVAITYEGTFAAGSFNATGSAVDSGLLCPEGTMMGASEALSVWEHTFFCADGTGRTTLAIDARTSDIGAVGNSAAMYGTWTVIGVSGALEPVTGTGKFSGERLAGHCSWEYTGHLEIAE